MRGLVPYAWRSLAARPARSLLTAFGIAIGVAVLVAALAVDAGLDASVQRTVDATVGRADLRVGAFTEAGLSRPHARRGRRASRASRSPRPRPSGEPSSGAARAGRCRLLRRSPSWGSIRRLNRGYATLPA